MHVMPCGFSRGPLRAEIIGRVANSHAGACDFTQDMGNPEATVTETQTLLILAKTSFANCFPQTIIYSNENMKQLFKHYVIPIAKVPFLSCL